MVSENEASPAVKPGLTFIQLSRGAAPSTGIGLRLGASAAFIGGSRMPMRTCMPVLAELLMTHRSAPSRPLGHRDFEWSRKTGVKEEEYRLSGLYQRDIVQLQPHRLP